MLNYVSWPKALIVTGGLAVWALGGMWTFGSYMLGGVERSIGELRAEASERFSAREEEDRAGRAELADAMRELRLELAALRKDVGSLGNRVVASNGKVGDRIDVLRKELAAAIDEQGERLDATVARLNGGAGALTEEIALLDRDSFEQRSKRKARSVMPPRVPETTP